MGSNHAAPEKLDASDAGNVMAGAKSLCLEVTPADQAVAKQAMRVVLYNTSGKTLAERHGAKLAADVKQALMWNKLLAAKLDNFSDQALGTFLWLLPPSQRQQPTPAMVPGYSIDAALLSIAQQRNLSLKSIEDVHALANAASRMSDDEWTDYLQKSLDFSTCEKCLQEFARHTGMQYTPTPNYENAYRENRLAFGLNSELFHYFDRLTLGARNPSLASNIYEQALRRNECDVVAIGAAHLGGQDGVVSLLKKMGATVSPVAPEN